MDRGDTVLADIGFNIHKAIAMVGARMEIPAFTPGKQQLDATDVENTRKIGSVQQAIGTLRQKFLIV